MYFDPSDSGKDFNQHSNIGETKQVLSEAPKERCSITVRILSFGSLGNYCSHPCFPALAFLSDYINHTCGRVLVERI